MITSKRRRELLSDLAGLVPTARGEDCVRVAVDGVDGAGKTRLADEIAAVLREQARDVVRISADDFHHPRSVRYRRGRSSPEGFWLDSYDYQRLHADVLDPLGPGGDRRYRRIAHDLRSDVAVRPPMEVAPPGAVLVLDGLFLHRDGLADLWDLSIWLHVPFEVTVRRMAARDGTEADLTHPSLTRYVDGQRLYLGACDPAARAHVVIDNTDLDAPTMRVRSPPRD